MAPDNDADTTVASSERSEPDGVGTADDFGPWTDDDGEATAPADRGDEAFDVPDDDFVFDFDGTGDGIDAETPPAPPAPQAPAPMMVHTPPPPGPMAARRRARLQARKVRRIVRHVEPWSVLKISLIFYFCLWLIFLLAGVLLWSVAVSSGIIGKVENFIIELFALEEFSFNAGEIFRGYALGGLVMVFAATAFNVLLCVLFNLISDLTGGLRVTVIEEETARFMPRRGAANRRAVRRRS